MSDLRLTVLGCDGSWPGPDGATSGYLIRSNSTTILVDIGSGTLAHLQHFVKPSELDAVFVTHAHPDHCSDLNGLDVLLAKSLDQKMNLPVYAAPGVKAQTFSAYEPNSEFVWTELEDGDEIEVGEIQIRTARTDHGPVTFGLRITNGKRVLAYGADSGPAFDFATLGPNIDFALIDSAEPAPSVPPGHLNELLAAEMAAKADASKLMLTHIRPGYDREAMRSNAAALFDGEVLLATHGVTYVV